MCFAHIEILPTSWKCLVSRAQVFKVPAAADHFHKAGDSARGRNEDIQLGVLREIGGEIACHQLCGEAIQHHP